MENKQKKYNIRIFSTPGCPQCGTLKSYLDTQGIKYSDINVAEDTRAQEEMINKSGQMSVPVIEINNQIIVGFDLQKINQILGI